jgi:hypothetical protein
MTVSVRRDCYSSVVLTRVDDALALMAAHVGVVLDCQLVPLRKPTGRIPANDIRAAVWEATELQANYFKATLQISLAQSRGLEATTKPSKKAAQPLAELAARAGKRLFGK